MERIDAKTLISELGQQLEVSETRCESIKSQLSYMKNLYQGFPTEPTESLKSQGYSPRRSQSTVISQSSLGSNEFKEFLIKENYQMKSYMSDIKKMKSMIEETIAESPGKIAEKSIKSQISLEKINSNFSNDGKEENERIKSSVSLEKIDSNFSNAKEENKRQKSELGTESPRTMILSPRKKENESCRDGDSSHEILQINFDINSEKDCYSQIIKSPRKQVIEMPNSFEKQEVQVDDIRELESEPKQKESVSRRSRSRESTLTNKKKKLSRSDKNYNRKGISNKSLTSRRKSSGKLEDSIITIAKARKKKSKLRSVNSKSTIATRDTSLSERKDRRKKHKSFSQKNSQSLTSHRQQNEEISFGKPSQNSSDVVELYHNMAVKSGSLSVVSSKHSRMDPHFQESLHGSSSINAWNRKPECLQQEMKKSATRRKMQSLNTFDEEIISNGTAKQDCKEETLVENIDSDRSHYLQSYAGSKFYDPMMVRNYEQPTVSSKLKRVQRSYYNRFNFRNIPFVVGTSISPSHNLGLNIQQVLSIMKAKQSSPSRLSPLLIRKVSEGIQPMASLLTQMSSRNGFPTLDNNERLKESLNYQSKTTQSISVNKMSSLQNYSTMQQNFSTRNTCETLFEEKEENDRIEQIHKSYTKQSQNVNNKMIKGKKLNVQPQISQSSLIKQKQVELNMGDNNLSSYQSVSDNSKGIRDVLMKLHDQFEEMNTRYEKLQEKAEKTKNKSLMQEVEKLETELTAKEEEISAVVSLYKEVMALKKQMKMMAERNSFVCISTESTKPYPMINNAQMPIIRAPTATILKMPRGQGSINGSIREPSTGTRLTGLLRQIQMFQKQLSQVT